MLRRGTARLPDQTAHRVPQQADIRGVVHIGLNHERVTPPAQGHARLFSCDRMAALHDQLVDLYQQFGTQKAHIVHQCLVLVAMFVPNVRMAQEPTQRPVLVHQFVQPVEIAAKTLLDNSHHKDPPHLHARPTHTLVDPGKNVLVQERKQPRTKRLVAVQILKAQQQGRNVIPGLEVQRDVLDANLTKCHLRVAYLSHACLAKNCKN